MGRLLGLWIISLLIALIIPGKHSLSIPTLKSKLRATKPLLIRGGSVGKNVAKGHQIPQHSDMEWMLGQLCLRQQRALVLSSALTEAGFRYIYIYQQSYPISFIAFVSVTSRFVV
jgi:hypothetical protein